jgi:hypothetical protein
MWRPYCSFVEQEVRAWIPIGGFADLEQVRVCEGEMVP